MKLFLLVLLLGLASSDARRTTVALTTETENDVTTLATNAEQMTSNANATWFWNDKWTDKDLKMRVWLQSASDLPRTDFFGKIETYVICELTYDDISSELATRALGVLKSTPRGQSRFRYPLYGGVQGLNPVYTFGPHEFTYRGQDSLVCTVWDNDSLRKDDLIGKAVLKPVSVFSGNLPLLDKDGVRTQGTLTITVKATNYKISVLGVRNARTHDLFGSKADPYVICKVGKRMFRTKTKWQAGADASFEDGPYVMTIDEDEDELLCALWDNNRLRLDRSMAEGVLFPWPVDGYVSEMPIYYPGVTERQPGWKGLFAGWGGLFPGEEVVGFIKLRVEPAPDLSAADAAHTVEYEP